MEMTKRPNLCATGAMCRRMPANSAGSTSAGCTGSFSSSASSSRMACTRLLALALFRFLANGLPRQRCTHQRQPPNPAVNIRKSFQERGSIDMATANPTKRQQASDADQYFLALGPGEAQLREGEKGQRHHKQHHRCARRKTLCRPRTTSCLQVVPNWPEDSHPPWGLSIPYQSQAHATNWRCAWQSRAPSVGKIDLEILEVGLQRADVGGFFLSMQLLQRGLTPVAPPRLRRLDPDHYRLAGECSVTLFS